MKVKRYLANSTQEAMSKIKMELGKEAIILHSRKVKKPGIIGFFKKPIIEMVAAVEENHISTSQNKKSIKNMDINEIKIPQKDEIHLLKNQIGNIENMLYQFMDRIEPDKQLKESKGSLILDKYHELLLTKGMNQKIADQVLNIVSKQIGQSNEESLVRSAIKQVIAQYLQDPFTLSIKDNHPRCVAFVGPTGVGKTTTIAKIAAKLAIGQGKKVAFITADTYRIAAVEQLRTYGEILDIPVKVIYDMNEIQEAMESLKDKDYILIDTAGRNHKDHEQVQDIQKLIQNIEHLDIFLVISATGSYKNIHSIVKAYDFIKDYKLLFTKLDESEEIANILNIKVLTGKELSYITTGQSVPDDIEVIDKNKIASFIVGEVDE